MISVLPKLLRTSTSSTAKLIPSASRRLISRSISSWIVSHWRLKARRVNSNIAAPVKSTKAAPNQLSGDFASSVAPRKRSLGPSAMLS